MPYSKRQLLGDRRDKDSEGLLWQWGLAQHEGWWKGHAPADPDTPRLAAHFDSRLPCPDWLLDLSRAFAALNPALPKQITDLGFYRATRQFTPEQEAIWLYYVEGLGSEEFRRAFRAMSPSKRTELLDLWQANPGAYQVDDGSGDDLLGARLGITGRAAYGRRMRGVERMVAYLNPAKPVESAA